MINNLINVFLEPREVFTSLKEQNDWKNALIPLVISVLVGIASMMALGELLVEYQISETERAIMESSQIPEDKKEEILEDSLSGIMDPSPAMIAIGYFTSAISIRIMTMTAFTYMIANLESLVKVPLMISQWRMEVYTGLGLLGLGEKGSFLYNFMAGMDLFAVWRVIVLAVGMSVLYNRSTRPFAIAITIYWILQTTFLAFLGSLFA